jgi:hypothetical protein
MYRVGLCFSDASRSFAPRHRWDRLRDAGGLRGQRTCDEADGRIAVRHAPRTGRKNLRLSELLICDARDLVRPARRKRRAL